MGTVTGIHRHGLLQAALNVAYLIPLVIVKPTGPQILYETNLYIQLLVARKHWYSDMSTRLITVS